MSELKRTSLTEKNLTLSLDIKYFSLQSSTTLSRYAFMLNGGGQYGVDCSQREHPIFMCLPANISLKGPL